MTADDFSHMNCFDDPVPHNTQAVRKRKKERQTDRQRETDRMKESERAIAGHLLATLYPLHCQSLKALQHTLKNATNFIDSPSNDFNMTPVPFSMGGEEKRKKKKQVREAKKETKNRGPTCHVNSCVLMPLCNLLSFRQQQ